MELKIKKAQGELKNVNLRTENNGDERVLAVDLKLIANCAAKEVAPLFSDTPDLLNSLFDEGGNILNPVFQFTYRVPIENVELKIDALKPMKAARIKKNMTLIPRNGRRFEVTMTAQLHDVGDVRPLANRLHEEVTIEITEHQLSMDLDPKKDTAEENKAAESNGAKKKTSKKTAKKTSKKTAAKGDAKAPSPSVTGNGSGGDAAKSNVHSISGAPA